ncbi:MAG TPA: hypothetical protein VLB09_08440, partial [Nitrospiria bacterium]|nr:hypothetical protein [Nitrospiria bacterium]
MGDRGNHILIRRGSGRLHVFTVFFLIASFSGFVGLPSASAAISGTGDCAALSNPLNNPQTVDYTCTGNLTINSGSVQTLLGDV